MTEIRLSEPTFGGNEAAYLEACITSTFVSSVGPFVSRFEEEFAERVGARHAVAVATGTAALHLALLVAGVRPGDEVVVSDLTFVASANAARYCGAALTFVDSERETWNLDEDLLIDELEQRVRRGSSLPAAIVAVHVLGHPAKLGRLRALAAAHGIAFIEDAAEALGGRWRDDEHGSREVGSLGDFGCYSFNGNKIMTTGGGGMVVTADAALADRVRHLSTQARLPGPEYRHDEIGFNYRLTNTAAALGVAQLEHFDAMLSARRALAARYDEALGHLASVELPPNAAWAERTGWMYSILVPDRTARDDLIDHLAQHAVQARPIWVPMHLQAPYADSTRLGGSVCEDITSRALSLPCSAHLDRTDQERVIALVLERLDE